MGDECCANCGRRIGKLETPHIYEQHVVCADCISSLNRTPRIPPSPRRTGPSFILWFGRVIFGILMVVAAIAFFRARDEPFVDPAKVKAIGGVVLFLAFLFGLTFVRRTY